MLFVIIIEKHLFLDFIIDYDASFTVNIPRDNAISNIIDMVNNKEFFFCNYAIENLEFLPS